MFRLAVTLLAATVVVSMLGVFAPLSTAAPSPSNDAPKRIALVVTNASYSGTLSKLQSPHKDGDALTAALEAIGFEVKHARDVTRDVFRAEIVEFVKRFETAGEGAASFFYFSGHGAADREFLQNFMLPIGEISGSASLDKSAISLEDVIRPLEAAQSKSGKSFIVLDACRDVPPFVEANPKVTSSFVRRDRVKGMLIGYATDEGQVAADQNYFSNSLSSLLPDPELEAVRVFKKVKERVHQLSGERQTPWYEDGLIGDYYLARDVSPRQHVAAVTPPAPPATGSFAPPVPPRPAAIPRPQPTLPTPVVVPAGARLKPGQAILTQFSGFKPSSKGFKPISDAGSSDAKPDASSGFAMLPDVTGPVITVADLSQPGRPAAENQLPGAATGAPVVTAGDIGQVYGAAVYPGSEVATGKPRAPDLFLAATSAYGLSIVARTSDVVATGTAAEPQPLDRGAAGATWAPGQFGAANGGGPGTIWKVDGATGDVKLFADIALDGVKNRGPGLGQLAYDVRTRQLFVSDRQTGMIHRLSMSGAELGFYDHGVDGRPTKGFQPVTRDQNVGATGAAGRDRSAASLRGSPQSGTLATSPEFRPDTSGTWGFAADARHVWGLAVLGDRLYYGVAEGPSIWSVGLRIDGTFASDTRREVELNGVPPGSHIPRIDFDASGNLYLTVLAAHTAVDLQSIAAGSPRATPSAILRYRRQTSRDGGSPSAWGPDVEDLTEAAETSDRRPTAALALGYGIGSDGRIDPASCGGSVWVAAERAETGTPELLGWSGSAMADGGAPNHAAALTTGEPKARPIGSLTMVAPCAAPRQAGGVITSAGRPPEILPPRQFAPAPEQQTAAVPNQASPGSGAARPQTGGQPSTDRPPGNQGTGTDAQGTGPAGSTPQDQIAQAPPCMTLTGARFQCIGNAWELDVNLGDQAGKGLDSLKVSSLSPDSVVEPGLQRRATPADPFRIRFEQAPSGSQIPVDVCLFDLAASLSGRRYRCCRAELQVELPAEPCGGLAALKQPESPATATPANQQPRKP